MARQTKGQIIKRGRAYYIRYQVDHARKAVALKEADGRPVTDRARAEVVAASYMSPIVALDDVERVRRMRDVVEDAEARAERIGAEDEARRRSLEDRLRNEAATIEGGFAVFWGCPKKPKSCRTGPLESIEKHTTASNYRSYYERFSKWMREQYPEVLLLSEVSTEIAAAFMESVGATGASGTHNKYLMFLKCLYDVVLKAGKVVMERNPFSDVDRMDAHYHSKRPLTVEQIARLIDTATGEMRLLIALGYFTGLRLGDCCTLKWGEVDLYRGVIERIPRKTASRAKDPAQAVVKVGIAPYLMGLLTEIPAGERVGYVLPATAEAYEKKIITHAIMRHFASTGIETSHPGPHGRAVVDYGFHSLRYSYISHNAERGTPQAIIQRNAGHASPAMTEHYTRISDKAAREYAAVLDLPAKRNDDEYSLYSEDIRAELHRLADTLPLEEIAHMIGLHESMLIDSSTWEYQP